MKHTLIIACAAALLLTACIPSVNPFYTDKDVVFETQLVGIWQMIESGNQPETWKFGHSSNKVYDLTVTDNEGRKGQFHATLFRLEEQLFLDLIPTDCEFATNQNELVAASMFPGHLLMHVAQIEPELRLAFCDFDWLENHLKDNPEALAHLIEEKRILLTASTSDLQRFVLKYLNNGELFDDYSNLKKQSANQSEGVTAPIEN